MAAARERLREFLDAVAEMRAAQRLELDALPANMRIWKSARKKRTVSLLEESVDALVDVLHEATRSEEPGSGRARSRTRGHELVQPPGHLGQRDGGPTSGTDARSGARTEQPRSGRR